MLERYRLNYLLPLKRGNHHDKDRIPAAQSDYDAVFTYHGRAIQGKGFTEDDRVIHLYSDAQLYAYIKEMGTITVKTNQSALNSKQIYYMYKQRQAIERYFKTYGDTMEFETS